ncbi:MAG: YbbR-like domain-containing protein [bacterium]
MLNNLFIKILSLLLACILWFFVVVENKPETNFQVPLQAANLDRELGLATNIRDYQIDIKLKGPESILRGLTAQQLKMSLDLSGAKEGNRYFTLTAQDVTVPKHVQVVRIAPSEVHLIIEPIVQRIVPVEPVILGIPAQGYHLEEIRVFPDHVRLSGV